MKKPDLKINDLVKCWYYYDDSIFEESVGVITDIYEDLDYEEWIITVLVGDKEQDVPLHMCKKIEK